MEHQQILDSRVPESSFTDTTKENVCVTSQLETCLPSDSFTIGITKGEELQQPQTYSRVTKAFSINTPQKNVAAQFETFPQVCEATVSTSLVALSKSEKNGKIKWDKKYCSVFF